MGTVVAALPVAGTSLGVVSQFFHQERIETAVYTQPVTTMAIRTTSGDIRVTAGAPGSPVVIRRVLQWSFGRAGSAESITDGRLDVAARCSGGLGLGDCSVDYEVTAPPGLALRLDSHSGDVDVAGTAGDLAVSVHTGSITVLGARSGRAELSTSTGDIDVRFAVAPHDVRAPSSTGSVVVQVPSDGTSYDVRAATSTGDQSVRVPTNPTASRHIDARTSTGDIEVRPGP
ncbi:MAG: DUF4097 family beta strand repeat-containing protein [Kineosporiaceae bacterium]